MWPFHIYEAPFKLCLSCLFIVTLPYCYFSNLSRATQKNCYPIYSQPKPVKYIQLSVLEKKINHGISVHRGRCGQEKEWHNKMRQVQGPNVLDFKPLLWNLEVLRLQRDNLTSLKLWFSERQNETPPSQVLVNIY